MISILFNFVYHQPSSMQRYAAPEGVIGTECQRKCSSIPDCAAVAAVEAVRRCCSHTCYDKVSVSFRCRGFHSGQGSPGNSFRGYRGSIYSVKSMSDSCHHLATSVHVRDSCTTTADLACVRCDAGWSQTRHRARRNATLAVQCITRLFKLALAVQSHGSTALVM